MNASFGCDEPQRSWRDLLPLSSRHRLCVNNRHSAPFTTFLCSFHAQRLLARRVAVRRRQALPRLVLAQQVRPLPVRGCVRAVVKLDSGRVFPRCAPLNAPAPHLPPRKCVPPPPELAPADSPHSVWSGYFVSRSALKGYIRFASSVFQAAKQVQLLTGGAPDVSPANPLYRLERSMGERQGERRVARAANKRLCALGLVCDCNLPPLTPHDLPIRPTLSRDRCRPAPRCRLGHGQAGRDVRLRAPRCVGP